MSNARHDLMNKRVGIVTVRHNHSAVAILEGEIVALIALVPPSVSERRLTADCQRSDTKSVSHIGDFGILMTFVNIVRVISKERTWFALPRSEFCISMIQRARSEGVVQRPAAAISG